MKDILCFTFNGDEHLKRIELTINDIKEKDLNRCLVVREIISRFNEAIDEKNSQIKRHALLYGTFLIRIQLYIKNTSYNEKIVNELNVLRHLFYKTSGHKVIYNKNNEKTNEIDIKVNQFNNLIKPNDLHVIATMSIRTEATPDDYNWRDYFSK